MGDYESPRVMGASGEATAPTWDALSPGCQHAVDSLGYSPELWDAEAAVAARRFQEIGGTGFGRFSEPRRAQARLRLMAPPVTVVVIIFICKIPSRHQTLP